MGFFKKKNGFFKKTRAF